MDVVVLIIGNICLVIQTGCELRCRAKITQHHSSQTVNKLSETLESPRLQTEHLSCITCLVHSHITIIQLTLNCIINAITGGSVQGRVHVEKIGYKGYVELMVSCHHVHWRDKLSAVQTIGLLQHQLCSPFIITLLKQTVIKPKDGDYLKDICHYVINGCSVAQ